MQHTRKSALLFLQQHYIINHDFVIKYTSAWIIALWIFMDKVSNWENNINKCIVFGYILALHMHILAVYHIKQ